MTTMHHFPDKEEYTVKLKKKGIFYKYDEEFPTSILGSYLSKDEYQKIIKQINKILSYKGKILIFGCTIILFPLSMYYVVKSVNEFSKFFYDINIQLRDKNIHVACLMKPFNERKYGEPKSKIVFFYPKTSIASPVIISTQDQPYYAQPPTNY